MNQHLQVRFPAPALGTLASPTFTPAPSGESPRPPAPRPPAGPPLPHSRGEGPVDQDLRNKGFQKKGGSHESGLHVKLAFLLHSLLAFNLRPNLGPVPFDLLHPAGVGGKEDPVVGAGARKQEYHSREGRGGVFIVQPRAVREYQRHDQQLRADLPGGCEEQEQGEG